MMAKVQTDNLSVIKKYADYSKIKSNVERQFSQLFMIQAAMYALAAVFLVAEIWNIIKVKS